MTMNNEIILRSVYGKVAQKYFIQPCPNPKTGQLPSCVKTVDAHGDMILSEQEITLMNSGQTHYVPANKVFIIEDGASFNLDDVIDKANWEAIEFCNWIAKDRYQRDASGNLIIDGGSLRYGVADLYVERPGEITKAKVTRKQLIHDACSYIYEDSESNRIKKCRVLGRNLSTAIPADILDFLIEYAEKNPQAVINLYEGEDWKMHLFIIDAMDKGVIKKKDGLYNYEDKMLGGSVESVIGFLKDIRYRKILDSIKRETYPHLLSKQDINELENSTTAGIPHFDGTSTEEPATSSTSKPVKAGGISSNKK